MIDYNAEGCYKDSKKKSKKIFTKKFSTVNGVNRRNPDVEEIFLECKEMAEKEDYEIFAIQVKVLIYTKELWMSIRGVSRGRVQGVRTSPPEMTCGFLIQLVFCKKKICGSLVLK